MTHLKPADRRQPSTFCFIQNSSDQMKDYILQRKIARIIALIAERRGIPQSQALIEFYRSRVCQMLHDPQTEMHLMSDNYVVEEFLNQ